jgi:hypothetical protein
VTPSSRVQKLIWGSMTLSSLGGIIGGGEEAAGGRTELVESDVPLSMMR